MTLTHSRSAGGEVATAIPADLVLDFTVAGRPKPKGSLRHIGNGRLVEQVNGTPWRRAVRDAASDALRDAEPLAGPLRVEAAFTFPKPTAAPKRRITWPTTRASGDIDKQLRNLFDALVDSGVMHDDSQIIEVTAAKRYPFEGPDALTFPGVVVRIYAISDTGR